MGEGELRVRLAFQPADPLTDPALCLQIRDNAADVIYQLSQQKFQDPTTTSEDEIRKKYDALNNQIVETFREILE